MSVVNAVRSRAVNTLAESIYDNPVVSREFRTRMRGTKAFSIMGAYVLFLAIVVFWCYVEVAGRYANAQGQMLSSNPTIGMDMFSALTWVQAILLALIIPSVTSGALSQEVEKKTIMLLALTRLSPGKIVFGKQLAGFLYCMMLLIASVPIAGMCLMFGGISPAEIGITYALLVVWVFLFSSVGVFWSSMFDKTATASVYAYGMSGLYFLFTSISGIASSYSGNAFILSLLCVAAAPKLALSTAEVGSLSVSLAFAAILVEILLSALLLMIASTHVRQTRVNRSLSIRIMLILTSSVIMWLILGNSSVSYNSAKDMLSFASIIVMMTMLLATAVFSTGRIRKRDNQSALAYAFSLRKIFKNDVGGGLSFMLLWTAILQIVCVSTIIWAVTSMAQSVAGIWTLGIKIGLSNLAMVAGVSGLGILLSALFKDRKNAGAMVAIYVILAMVIYGIITANQYSMSQGSHPIMNLAAFWPFAPIVGLLDPPGSAKLAWPASVSWIVTSLTYLVIGFISLCLTNGALRKFGGIKED